MKYTEINIKESMPIVADAMRYLQDAIARLKGENYDVVLIRHGHKNDETGRDDEVCIRARQWLQKQVEEEKVQQVIWGEKFTLFHFIALTRTGKCSELEKLFRTQDPDVTVVEL